MILGFSGKSRSGKDAAGRIAQDMIFKRTGELWKIVKFADKLKDCICVILGCTREDLEKEEYKNNPLGEQWRIWQVADYYKGHLIDKYGLCSSEKEALDLLKEERESRSLDNSLKSKVISYILTPRNILQLLGTDCGREIIHPNLWINATLNSYNSFKDNWIITDVRFINEADIVKKFGGSLIRINRDLELRYPEDYQEYFIKRKPPLFTQYLIKKYSGVLTHPSECDLDEYEFDFYIKNNNTLPVLKDDINKILQELKII